MNIYLSVKAKTCSVFCFCFLSRHITFETGTKITCSCLLISTVQVYSYEQREDNEAVKPFSRFLEKDRRCKFSNPRTNRLLKK